MRIRTGITILEVETFIPGVPEGKKKGLGTKESLENISNPLNECRFDSISVIVNRKRCFLLMINFISFLCILSCIAAIFHKMIRRK